ncbi:MAG: carbohydrate kinase family protein [Spirochaetota bacterium]|nr:MAG: carbohydrate kinase family protein [Spirochaetota bacterium]
MEPLHISHRKYDAMIGTGGVGAGIFFTLNGMHTLGREESRSGHIIDRKDYCKLHIVSHYVKTLMGSSFEVFPIAKVGNDDVGRNLMSEIEEIGLNTNYMDTCINEKTLFSFCFIYPDGSGGNLTTDDSASSMITPEDIAKAEETFKHYGIRCIGLAVPEVPLNARIRLLDLATQFQLYRIASFTSDEMDEVRNKGILKKVDLLAINLDEALRFTGVFKEDNAEKIVNDAIESLTMINSDLSVTITSGNTGSWTWDSSNLNYQTVPEVELVSTAGAGDAFLAGMIAGITAGLKFNEAQELATLVATLSVTSPHTINKGIDRVALRQLANKTNYPISESVTMILSPTN